jgi:copper transport protein
MPHRLPQWLTRPSLFLHGVCRGLLDRRAGAAGSHGASAQRRPARVLKKFSAIAMVLVALLVLSGLVLSIIQLGSVRALIETQYGILLSIKLRAGDPVARLGGAEPVSLHARGRCELQNTRPLLGSILLECVLVVGILPSSPAGASRRRRAPPVAPVAAPLSVHITPMPRCFRCWFLRARSAPTILCCS